MSKLVWDQVGQRFYETGVDHCVLYPQKEGAYPLGVAWNGIISISENPSGAEDSPQYADNIKYLNLKGTEEFGATVECYTYPDEWMECDGSAEAAPGVMVMQQKRNTFGLVYRTRVGNDTSGDSLGYKLHLIYACSASPSERSYSTVNDSPEANTFSYEISTTAVPVSFTLEDGTELRPTSAIVIDSTKTAKAKLTALEDTLFGTEDAEPRLPMPDEVLTMMKNSSI